MQYKPHIQNLPAYKPPKLLSGPRADLVKLSSNENPLGPSPHALAALQDALGQVYRYPDAASVALREALAAHAGLSFEHVICSNGSDEMILLICLAFLDAGDEVVMAEGTFISYMLRTLEMGATPLRVPLHNYTHNLTAMAQAITPHTKLVFICNPNNPTGTANSAAEVSAFLDAVPPTVLVVMDEAYLEFVTRPDYPDLLPDLRAGRPNLVLLRTFAKIHGLAGLRLGYAYGSPEVIAYLDRARPTFNVNSLAQAAGIAALGDNEHVARSRAHADASRACFMEGLRAIGLAPIPSETNFVAVPVGDDTVVSNALFERGFSVTPLGIWGLPGLIRISFGTVEQNQAVLAALGQILPCG
ncbi:MAG: histidinol-phosphate transaminase [Candidatus Viridilinea halotolerans]|uniref:Histidinol-phosphate aminotransferase n=1 Tax=Candidatus Viridilinea halotolerans TaxID=2491704 RepID=A0A426U8T4_9CHLR|nr:MAG: histidinol-phosphate transaminase [Candidatus Viridilinea halotolerans]